MINIDDTIKDIANQELSSLLKIVKDGFNQKKVFHINCTEFIDYNYKDIRKSDKYRELFSDLERLSGSVLYYFEITSDCSSKVIVQSIKRYSSLPNSKNIPAIKKNYSNTNILYVGKVKKNFLGRVIQHFGFYKVNGTQGLQLYYWAKDLNLKLKLTAIQFEKDAENLMPIFEKKIADILKPIIGKHK